MKKIPRQLELFPRLTREQIKEIVGEVAPDFYKFYYQETKS